MSSCSQVRFARILVLLLLLMVPLALAWVFPAQASGLAQIPTVDIPTVTGTPSGPVATVRLEQDPPNVRSGPGVFYPKIGVLLPGQVVPVKGVSPKREWILIEYPGVASGDGWVYAPLVSLSPGELPIVEPPPTPTLQYTSTIDPTLASQFIITSAPTRLPTFTPPPPLVIPTYTDAVSNNVGGVPVGLIVISLAIAGILLGLFSLAQGR